MIRDLHRTMSKPEMNLDACIVGAGAAGIALAVELASKGKRVLLLEGGGALMDDAEQEPYHSEIGGLPHRGIHSGRFRVQGGTTTKWGGQILELDEQDFADRPWVPDSGWPFKKSELAPFYTRAVQLEGLAKAIESDDAVWLALGEPKPCLPELVSYLSRWCPEPNFARLHRAALEGPDIHLWLHANAIELLLDGGNAIGIRVSTRDRRETIFRAQRYIFCLGAIESSRFFLQPRNGFLPWNTSGLLGKHFQDHIDCNAATVNPRFRPEFQRLFDGIFLGGYKYQPKLKLSADASRREQILNTAASFAFDSTRSEALAGTRTSLKHLLRGNFRELKGAFLMSLVRDMPSFLGQIYRYAVKHRAYQPEDAVVSLRVHCEQEPSSHSAITLSDQRDSLGMLRTRLSWSISPLELRSIRTFVEHARKALAGVAEIVPSPALSSDKALIAQCEDSFHHMGGMRMHAIASRGVVTPELRLHGTSNVYVCSCAVFPTSGFSNPTHTLIALAVRLANHLTEK